MVPTLKISAVQVLGLAALGVVAGEWLRRRLPLLDRLNIPAPIAGGMLYAVATLLMRGRVANIEADTVLRDVEKYGAAPQAFLVVPVVGAFLIDFTNSLIITAMANLLP